MTADDAGIATTPSTPPSPAPRVDYQALVDRLSTVPYTVGGDEAA